MSTRAWRIARHLQCHQIARLPTTKAIGLGEGSTAASDIDIYRYRNLYRKTTYVDARIT
jgi:hypothetical protein